MFVKLTKVHLLVSELNIYQNSRYNDKNYYNSYSRTLHASHNVEILREYKQGFITDSRSNEIHFDIIGSVGVTRWRSWLKHCATSREVAVSISDGVIEIFY